MKVECPVHSPSTSKEIRDALKRTAKKLAVTRYWRDKKGV